MVSRVDQEEIIHAFMSSRLDYCNSLSTGLDKSSDSRLHALQNPAARLLTKSNK